MQSQERITELEESGSLTSGYTKGYCHQNHKVPAQKQKYRSVEQDRKSRNKPMHMWSIYNKGRKTIQWRKDNLFNNWCLKNSAWTAAYKRMKLAYSLTSYTKIKSIWIKDLNVRPDSIKLLEKKLGRTLFDTNLSNIFFFLIYLLE